MSRLSRPPSLRPVGCQPTAASLTKTPPFDVKIVKTSVLTTCRLPTYSCKFDKKHPCLILSRLPSLRSLGCQHTAASLTKTPMFDVKIVKTSVITTCSLPTYSCKFDKKTPLFDVKIVKTSVLTIQLQVWQIHPCLMSRLSRLPSLRPVGCQPTAASLTKHPCLMSHSPLFHVKIVKTSVLTTCRLHTAASLTKKTPLFDVKTTLFTTCRLPTYSCKWCEYLFFLKMIANPCGLGYFLGWLFYSVQCTVYSLQDSFPKMECVQYPQKETMAGCWTVSQFQNQWSTSPKNKLSDSQK